MQLVGMMDSPYVRRVAISAQFLGLAYEHKPLSIFNDLEKIRAISSLVKVPMLVCDDGQKLVDSTLIIDYLESELAAGKTLMPAARADRVRSLQVIGVALVAMEKVVALIYETRRRPPELQHAAWIERVDGQLRSALAELESAVGDGSAWLFGPDMTQADITLAVTWRFVQYVEHRRIAAAEYPGLVRFSARAEERPEFIACPLS